MSSRPPASNQTCGRSKAWTGGRTASTLVAAARRDGRGKVVCITLGRGESVRKVRSWLATAASVSGFVGFAVGRTTFWEALVGWRSRRITREAAVKVIAERYRLWV